MSRAPGIRFDGAATLNGSSLFAPLNLEIAAGRWTCLLGPSGIGKSTILRLIAGLTTEAQFSGEIVADDGAPLDGRTSYMAQDDLLMPWLDVLGNACSNGGDRQFRTAVAMSALRSNRPVAHL